LLIIGVYLIYPFLLQGTEAADVYSDLELTDYYHFDATNEPHGYLIGYAATMGYRREIGKHKLEIQYHKEELLGQISHLSAPDDRISLTIPEEYLRIKYRVPTPRFDYCPGIALGQDLGLSIGLDSNSRRFPYYGELIAQMQRATVSYQIDTESGDIPFYWIKGSLKAGLKTDHYDTWLSYQGTFPYRSDSLFANAVNVHSIRYNLVADWEPVTASAAIEYGRVVADLEYRGEQYGKIDNLQYMTLNSSIFKAQARWSYGLELDGFMSGSGSDSYFDIWPFTFWDTFLAHRTRLKSMTVDAISPGLSVNYSTKADSVDGWRFQLGFGYHHLFHNEDILLKNRRVVLYPFVYTYDSDHYNWQDDIDAYVSLPVVLGYRFKRGNVGIALQQLAPVHWNDLSHGSGHQVDPSPDPSSTKSRWGGLYCKVDFIFIL